MKNVHNRWMTPSPRRHSLLPFACAIALTACAGTPTRSTSAPPPTTHATAIDVPVPAIVRPAGETAAWWFRDGASQAAARGAMGGRAKNVIIFLGDGMSLTTVAAARIFEGQRKGGSGEENRLAWETFPATALSKTYNTDSQTPDSAGTMSAIATGVKTRAGVLSIGQSARRKDCAGCTRGTGTDPVGAGLQQRHGNRRGDHRAGHPCHPRGHLYPFRRTQLGERRRPAGQRA